MLIDINRLRLKVSKAILCQEKSYIEDVFLIANKIDETEKRLCYRLQ